MSLSKHYIANIQPKLDAIEQIRAHLTEEKVSVPGVVVAGAQSAGKSSVLEALSGVNLPRGETITTRVPLLLRMECRPYIENPYALIGTDPDLEVSGKRISDLELVAGSITELTRNLAGEGGAVQDKPIHLKIVKADGPTMSLIDLPGIAYTSADSNVEEVIQEQTTALIKKYCEQQEMIILVVVPAVDDFAACEALKIAKQFDREGERTLGVVTKSDMIGIGTDFVSKMHAEGPGHIKLKLGFVALRNRTSNEISQSITLDAVKELERDFFMTSNAVKGLKETHWGLDTLVRKIVLIQGKKVSEFLPRIRALCKEKLVGIESELKKLRNPLADDSARRNFLLQTVHRLKDDFRSLAAAEETDPKMENVLVCYKSSEFYDEYKYGVLEFEDFLSDEYKAKLQYTKGSALPNFLSHPIFRKCVQEATQHIPVANKALVTSLEKLSLAALFHLIEFEVGDKPNFVRHLKDAAESFLHEKRVLCEQHLQNMYESEQEILTLDPRYSELMEKVKDLKVQKKINTAPSSELAALPDMFLKLLGISSERLQGVMAQFNWDSLEDHKRLEMQLSLKTYCTLVGGHMSEGVPKVAKMFLITRVYQDDLARGRHDLASYLLQHLGATQENLEEMLLEDPEVAAKRESLQASWER
ncbi:unnamed protein product, partial [Heterosigma akashiwo]